MQSSYWSLDKLPGLDLQEQKLLKKQGITTTKELLFQANDKQHREELAGRLKINLKYINKWVALADLARIPSINYQYCGLVLHSGIGSVSQLTQTPFHRLHRQVARLQIATFQSKDLTPSIEQVKQWVEQARSICSYYQ
jgi:Domain of unknown function (DUF4332)